MINTKMVLTLMLLLLLLQQINVAIGRMTVATLKAVLKRISESSIPVTLSYQGNKKPLQDRLIAHFRQLKDSNMAEHYQESRRILEGEFGNLQYYVQPR